MNKIPYYSAFLREKTLMFFTVILRFFGMHKCVRAYEKMGIAPVWQRSKIHHTQNVATPYLIVMGSNTLAHAICGKSDCA